MNFDHQGNMKEHGCQGCSKSSQKWRLRNQPVDPIPENQRNHVETAEYKGSFPFSPGWDKVQVQFAFPMMCYLPETLATAGDDMVLLSLRGEFQPDAFCKMKLIQRRVGIGTDMKYTGQPKMF